MNEPDYTRGTKLYVPKPGSSLREWIAAGSAVVGTPLPSNMIEIYYEGAVRGQAMTFETKVLHAWGRCTTRYPTVAMAVVHEADLIEVADVEAVTSPRINWHGDDITVAQDWINAARGPDADDSTAGSAEHNRKVPGFTCPDCGRTSYHPVDELLGWCGACDKFTRGDTPQQIRDLAEARLSPGEIEAVKRRVDRQALLS